MTKRNLVLLAFSILWLSACTMSKPPSSYSAAEAEGLYPGQEISIEKSENLYAFAQRHNVRLRELIIVNELKAPYVLRPGQKVFLPTKDKYMAPVPKAAPLDAVDKRSLGGGTSSTSDDVTAVPLAPVAAPQPSLAPASVKPFDPSSGVQAQPLKEAASAPMPQAETVNAPVSAAKVTNLSNQKPRAATEVAEVDLPSTLDLNKNEQAKKSEPLTKAMPGFSWPVRGTIISAFGPKGQGLDNDGLNIAAPKGSPVKAAEGGMVAYAGNEMKGFGNLVLIRHEGGWVTAYAHLERVVVVRDSTVAKGDMIGTVGTTGGVSSPQLHFEARQDGKPVDPELVLK